MTRRKVSFALSETNDAFFVTLPKPSLKYVDFFLSLECVGTLCASGAYPNAKEITETIGVFEGARRHLKLAHGRSDVLAVSVGDGVFPRTAGYAAYLSQWTCLSVDPLLRLDDPRLASFASRTRRLELHAKNIEDVAIDANGFADVVFLFVHSHASVHAAIRSLKNAEHAKIHAVSMPCCFGDDLGIKPSTEFEDPHVLSVRRTVQIYADVLKATAEARPVRSLRPGASEAKAPSLGKKST